MKIKLIAFLALSVFSVSSMASYDVAFYTNGNFQTIVDAFKRVSLYYGANNAWIIGVFIAGVLISAATTSVNSSTQQLSGNNSGNVFLTSLGLSVVGLLVFSAGTLPKGTVNIYDQEKNQYEPVAGVPAIISLTAGGLSSVVEAFRDTEDTANAYTYGELSSGSPFELIKESMESSKMLSSYLIQNINSMYRDCGSSAIASGRLDVNELRSNTFDLMATLEGLKHNSIETTVYSSAHPSGEAATCGEAHTYIKSELADPAVFDPQLSSVCSVMGLNSSVASEKTTCLGALTNSFDTIYANGTSSIDWKTGLQNMLIAQAISESLQSNSGSEAVNMDLSRKGLASSMGAMEASARFVPVIQGVLLSVIIGASPVLLMFVVTPLIGKALKLYFGLLAFYGIWQMTDMVTLSAMEDSLYSATSFLIANKMGLLSVWQTQSSVVDSFSVLGTARTIGLSVAVFISATLFQVSAHGLAGFAQKAEGDIDAKGSEAGEDAYMSEKAGEKMDSLVKGNSNLAAYSGGISSAVRSDTFDRSSDIRSGNLTADNLGGINSGAQAVAENSAASTVGNAQATQAEGFESATESSRITKEGDFAGSSAIQNIASVTGQNTRDMQEDTALAEEGRKAGEAQEMGEGEGIASNAIHSGQDDGARARAVSDIVSKQGTDDTYRAARQEHEKETETAKSIDELTGNSSKSYIRETADRETLETQGSNKGASFYSNDSLRYARAGDYIEDTRSSITTNDVAGGRLVDRDQLTDDRITSEVNDDIAEQNLRSGIKETAGIGDTELSAMLVGSKELNVSEENAEKFHEAEIINDAQLATANREGGVVLDVNATAIPQEGLDVQSVGASYTESSKVDKSLGVDNSINYESSMGSMNEASARVLYSDAEQTTGFIQDAKAQGVTGEDLATEVGAYSSGGLQSFFSGMTEDINEGRGSVNAKIGTPEFFGSSVSAETSASVAELDTQTVNSVSRHFAGVFSGIDSHFGKEVESGNMTQEEADARTGEIYSDYYGSVKNVMANGDLGELNKPLINGDLNDVWDNYSENNNLGIERSSAFDRNDQLEDNQPQKSMPTGSGLYNPSEMQGNSNLPLQESGQANSSMPPDDQERSTSGGNLPQIKGL